MQRPGADVPPGRLRSVPTLFAPPAFLFGERQPIPLSFFNSASASNQSVDQPAFRPTAWPTNIQGQPSPPALCFAPQSNVSISALERAYR